MILLLSLLSCKEITAVSTAATPALALRTGAVEATTWLPTVELTGNVEPVAMVQLGFDVPGRIEALLVERGQAVRKGDAIARLDARIASAQLAQAEAALAGARAQVEAAEAAWKRIEQIKAAGGVSEQQYSDTKAQIEAGRAGLQQAEAGVRMARANVDFHTLRSPINGILTNGPDNAGIMTGAGTPMFLIEDLSTMQLKGTVGEEYSWVAAGQPASLQAGTPGTEVTVAAEVLRVLPSLDMATRRIPVELRIVAPPLNLKAHGFSRATITAAEPQPALAIPKAALVARPDFCVFVQAAADQAPTRVPVAVLKEEGDKVLVRGKIEAGNLVVLDPPYSLGAE